MGIYLPDDQKNPALRSWYLRDLDGWSGAGAGRRLDWDARLFGGVVQNFGSLLEQIASEEQLKDPTEIRKAIQFYKSGK